MSSDVLILALLAGFANWAFRALPTLFLRGEARESGLFSGFLAATGPAAIATLFLASVLPLFAPEKDFPLAALTGVIVTILAFLPKRSVVTATLAGAFACGVATFFSEISDLIF